jgi:putative hydrolase of the HAD superfamily
MIKAITFDLWYTIVIDDSDETKRAEHVLPTKVEARRKSFNAEVSQHHPTLEAAKIDAAWEAANAWFRHCWKVEHHTPGIAERVSRAFDVLQVAPTPGFDALVAHLGEMEVEIPPDLVPGIQACLEALKGQYKIGIVSDAIVTPGSGLRKILENHGLLDYFDCFVFSDEAGAAKPDRKVFDVAAAGLGVAVEEIAHIGDREGNDIAGPLGVGAKAVLYTGAIDRGSDNTAAHLVVSHHRDLPAALERLGR